MMARVLVLALVAFAQCRFAWAGEDLTLAQARLGNIFLSTETVRIPVHSSGTSIAWSASDFFGTQVAEGVATVRNGRAVIEPELGRNGYFEMTLAAKRAGKTFAEARTTFAVIPPAEPTDPSQSRFGVMTHFAQGWGTDIVPLIAKAGIRHIRDEQYWNSVEKTLGEYRFSEKYTGYMRVLSEHGIEPLIIMSFTNKLYDDGLTPYTDAGREGYAKYGRAILDRYGEQIRALEVWNEYNGSFADGPAAEDRPRYYTQMLERAYQEIKSARPDAQVLGAAVVKVPLPYLERLFDHGALDFMDAVAVHPYRGEPEGVEREIRALKALMERYNHGVAKPIWVTEYGRKDSSPGGRHETARYLVRLYTLLLSEDVERIYWYLLRDYANFEAMGLLHDADSPLGRYVPAPSYVAYATLIRLLDGARYVRREPTDSRTRIYLFENDGEEVRVGWSTAPPSRVVFTTTSPLTVTDIMGEDSVLYPVNGQVVLHLTDTPIYVRGRVTAVQESRRDEVLADSAADFGGAQGENGWYYGHYDGDGRGEGDGAEPSGPYTDDDFEQLAWDHTEWGHHWTDDEFGELSLALDVAHPSATEAGAVWAVRRWKSPVDGTVRIVGSIRRSSSRGDGSQARILVGGAEVFSADLGSGDRRSELEYDLRLQVSKGTILDFAVTPGPGSDIHYDATSLTAQILYPY